MKTLVEKMARAICAAQGLDWKDQFSIYSSNGDPLAHEAYMHDADAALSALRTWLEDERLVVVPAEPTPRMFEANSKCTSQELWAGIGWAAMISAAPDALKAPDPAP